MVNPNSVQAAAKELHISKNFLLSVSHEVVCIEQLTHKDVLHPGSGPQTSQAEEVAITPSVQQNPTRIQKRPSQHSQEIYAK